MTDNTYTNKKTFSYKATENKHKILKLLSKRIDFFIK